MSSPLRAAVALPVPVDRSFDYTVPAGMVIEPGVRVLVPYGSRRLAGVVVSVTRIDSVPHGSAARPLKPIARVLSNAPALSPRLLRVVLAAAQSSLTPPGIALMAALPPGSAPRPTRLLALTDTGQRANARGEAPSSLRALLGALERSPLDEAKLRREVGDAAAHIERLVQIGWLRREDGTTGARARAKTERIYRLVEPVDLEGAKARLARAPKQLALLERLQHEGTIALPSTPALRALLQSGLVEGELREVARGPIGEAIETPAPPPTLTAAQARAVEAIEAAIAAERGETFLLYGITGSGKTEVYLRAALRALESGRGVIVLVPEISLTHQLVGRFRARFGDRVAVLHSGLSESERLDQWRRIQTGSQPIAIGARSAIFAPFDRVGLIVVDEEHDASYQSEDGFRYDARELASALGQAHGCPVVLGSATPDVATAYRASKKAITRLLLPERVARRPLPTVEIIDMEHVQRAPGPNRILSQPLRTALAQTLAAKQQAILFLNRRGFATYVYCFHCGEGLRCKHCDISLVYHATGSPARRDRSEQGELRCHYCGYTEEPQHKCPACGRSDGALLGFGTERLEEEVAAMFPRARVARLDRDTSARKGAQQRILAAFHRGDTDVLVGTQMVAKGHDIPNVTLVGVIAADMGLHLPDYRAGERTFQLLTQVAGRAGRGDDPGRVVIQTFLPNHYAIALAKTHDYPSFYREELSRREPHGYPPFRSLTRVEIAGPDAQEVQAAAELLVSWLREAPGPDTEPVGSKQAESVNGSARDSVQVLGPAPAPLARIRDQYRWQLLLLGPRSELLELGRQILGRSRAKLRSVQVRVVPSPVQML